MQSCIHGYTMLYSYKYKARGYLFARSFERVLYKTGCVVMMYSWNMTSAYIGCTCGSTQ